MTCGTRTVRFVRMMPGNDKPRPFEHTADDSMGNDWHATHQPTRRQRRESPPHGGRPRVAAGGSPRLSDPPKTQPARSSICNEPINQRAGGRQNDGWIILIRPAGSGRDRRARARIEHDKPMTRSLGNDNPPTRQSNHRLRRESPPHGGRPTVAAGGSPRLSDPPKTQPARSSICNEPINQCAGGRQNDGWIILIHPAYGGLDMGCVVDGFPNSLPPTQTDQRQRRLRPFSTGQYKSSGRGSRYGSFAP